MPSLRLGFALMVKSFLLNSSNKFFALSKWREFNESRKLLIEKIIPGICLIIFFSLSVRVEAGLGGFSQASR